MGTSLKKSILGQCELVAGVLKSLAHPTRLKILCQLLDGEKSVNDLTEFCEISQSAMSQFLGRMREDGILTSRRERQYIYYSIQDKKLIKLLHSMKEIYC